MKLVSREEIATPDVVYNLHVENNHNYIANGVVVSNCHGAKANVVHKLLTDHGKNIPHRFGLTGTLPDHPCELLMVQVGLGSVKYKSYAKDLIAIGWLAVPHISVVQLNDMQYLLDSGVKEPELLLYEEEQVFFRQCADRTQWIAKYIMQKQESAKVGNILVLVNNIAYGKKLAKLIDNSTFLYGKDDNETRQKVYELFEVRDDVIAICTKQIAGVGLSIDRIFVLIYIDAGKAFINTIQTIGRGLRKGRDKDSVDVIDLCSNLPTAEKHLKKRIKYYKEAQYAYKKFKQTYESEDVL